MIEEHDRIFAAREQRRGFGSFEHAAIDIRHAAGHDQDGGLLRDGLHGLQRGEARRVCGKALEPDGVAGQQMVHRAE